MKRVIMFFLSYLWGPRKKFLIYHLRWQMGFILTPFLYLFLDYLHLNYWFALILLNIVGAFIFFPIDKHIFGEKAKEAKITTHDT